MANQITATDDLQAWLQASCRCEDREGGSYRRPPFAADVRAARSGRIYDAHAYHTKVPPQGILPYLEHYTQAGDLVLDPFCGSGMTGVAALLCPSGPRRALLNDLSPAACHIAANYCTPVDAGALADAAARVCEAVRAEFEWLYGTACGRCGAPATIQYTIWSDLLACAGCGRELLLWEAGVDHAAGKVLGTVRCPACGRRHRKRELPWLRRAPVVVSTLCSRPACGRHQCPPTAADQARLDDIERRPIPYWHPRTRLDRDIDLWYERDYRRLGIYSVADLYTKRNLWACARLWREIGAVGDDRLRGALQFVFTAICAKHATLMTGIIFKGGRRPVLTGNIPGTLYVPSLSCEKNVLAAFARKLQAVRRYYEGDIRRAPPGAVFVRLGSAADLSPLADRTVDYVFTDPPFGENLIYSDLSLIWEAWMGRFTDPEQEAVIHRRKRGSPHTLADYSRSMGEAFAEAHRVLKPDRWASVIFHNTDDRVWGALQDAAVGAGFELASAVALDKEQRSFKQITAAGAAGYDVVLNLRRRATAAAAPRGGEDVDAFALNAVVAHLRAGPPPDHRRARFLHSLAVRGLLNAGIAIERVSIPYLEALFLRCGLTRVAGRWHLPGEVPGAAADGPESADGPHSAAPAMDEVLLRVADRAVQRALETGGSGRPPIRPNAAAVAGWIHYCAGEGRWPELLRLFPLLTQGDVAPEEWAALERLRDAAWARRAGSEGAEAGRRGGKTVKKVLFVCVHNSGRSKMAEAFLNQMAAGRGITALSAGTQPGDAVNPTVVAAMREVGIDLSGEQPRRLTPEMGRSADRVITMGCGVADSCPAGFLISEDWGLDDPKDQPLAKVRAIRDQIRERVAALIAER
ncbi:MAG: hypothetical protein HY321_11460 [Armatimonadetes bacterium]|nr:hypothetical protein [Armatimonadota bacterium]